MENELDTQELTYSLDLDSSNNCNEEIINSPLQESLDTQELTYSVHLSSSDSDLSSEGEHESDALQPYDFEPLIKDIPKQKFQQTCEPTIKRKGDINWCQCGLCQVMDSEAESLCCLDTNEVPDDYFVLCIIDEMVFKNEVFFSVLSSNRFCFLRTILNPNL